MSSTKIINVLRTDGFDEILDIFSKASAEEVIFVLPKRGKAFNREEHFAILNNQAQQQGKTVSLLSANPDINSLGLKYGFQLLSAGTEKRPKVAKPKLEQEYEPVATLAVTNDEDVSVEDQNEDSGNVEKDDDAELPQDSYDEDEDADKEDEIKQPGIYDGQDNDGVESKPVDEDDGNDWETSDVDEEDQAGKDGDDYFSAKKQKLASAGQDEGYEVMTAAKINNTLQDMVRSDAQEAPKKVKIIRRGEASSRIDVRKDKADVYEGQTNMSERALNEIKNYFDGSSIAFTTTEPGIAFSTI